MINKKIIIFVIFVTSLLPFVSGANSSAVEINNIKNSSLDIENDIKNNIAKRGGGFKSSSFKSKKSVIKKTNNNKTSSSNKNSSKTDTKTKRGGFLGGMFGGLLAGTLLGSLLGAAFGGGLGTFLMILILAGLAWFIWKSFKKKRENKINEEVEKRMREKERFVDVEEIK